MAQAIIGLEPLYGASALVLLFIPNPYWWGGLAIALVPWGLRWWHLGYPSQRTPFDLPIALFALSLILGFLSSVDRSLSAEALRGYLGAILGYYLLINHRDPRWFRFYLTIFAIIVALVSVWTFDAWATGTVKVTLVNRWLHSLLASLPHLPTFMAAQPSLNAIAGMAQVLIPLLAGLALFELPGSRRWSAMGTLAFTAVLILTSSRAAWLGLVISLFFLSVLRTRWAWAGGALITGAVALAIQRGLFNLDALETLTSEQDLVYRTGIWQGTWLMLQQAPYTGLGPGTFPLLYPFFTPPSQPLAATNPHNVLLQLYADGGILAVAAAGWGTIVFARLAYATLRAPHSRFWTAIAAGTVAALLGHAVYGVFESVISLTFRDGSGGFHYIPSPLPWIMGAFLVVAWREALHTKSLPSLTIDRSVEALVR